MSDSSFINQDVNVLIQELMAQGIYHPEVLNAIKNVPRERFVLPSMVSRAYDNTALPIKQSQTISQPYIVALMTQLLMMHPNPKKVLEIGTGSGYQAAILATLFEEVWTIELHESLQKNAKTILDDLGFNNIHFKVGDGALGWPDAAPFDCIIVTAAAPDLPPALIEQLNPDYGILVIPIGKAHYAQRLMLIKKIDNQISHEIIESVVFVPLVSPTL